MISVLLPLIALNYVGDVIDSVMETQSRSLWTFWELAVTPKGWVVEEKLTVVSTIRSSSSDGRVMPVCVVFTSKEEVVQWMWQLWWICWKCRCRRCEVCCNGVYSVTSSRIWFDCSHTHTPFYGCLQSHIYNYWVMQTWCLQCFDALGWVARRTYGL